MLHSRNYAVSFRTQCSYFDPPTADARLPSIGCAAVCIELAVRALIFDKDTVEKCAVKAIADFIEC
jgi:hypothetical protein